MVHIRDESARFSQEDFLKLLLGSLGGVQSTNSATYFLYLGISIS